MLVQPEGNYYDKYATKNPIERSLMNGFFKSMDELLESVKFASLYEAGCGEGHVLEHIHGRYTGVSLAGSDLSSSKAEEAKRRVPTADISCESIYELPCSDESYDLVVASEVLEHLEEPGRALNEALRISRRYVLLSVPNEPIWRVCNMARGKYWRDTGNTPGHIQHWSPRGFYRFVAERVPVIGIKRPFPWVMAMCEKRNYSYVW